MLAISSCEAVSNSWFLALVIQVLNVEVPIFSKLAISVNVVFSFRLSAFSTACILNDVVKLVI